MADRAKLFEEVQDPSDDLSRFAPRPTAPPAPPIEQVREVSTAAGFPNRDARQPIAPIAERHYYRTGRDTQFNTKVKADTKAAYMAIATEDGIPLGKVLEDALDALLRQRQASRQ